MPDPTLIQVWVIIDCDGPKRIVDVCSTKELADEAAPAWNEWHGHASAEVAMRHAVVVGNKILLLANDFGPEITLESSRPVHDAKLRMQALSKLSIGEAQALGLKGK